AKCGALLPASAEPEQDPLIGTIVGGRYRIIDILGEGGMGRVYRARDIRLERDVAIKVHSVVAVDGRQWSFREAAALAQLSHPNVVTVFEVGTWSEHPWVAMQYVPGGTARTWLAAKPRATSDIIALFVAAGRGLAAAHEVGIVHRDFKPDNVLVTAEGQPLVADFGLALELRKPDQHANFVLGTPAYMAPEQWEGRAVGAAADQFAYAVALWEALAGERPFQAATEPELREALHRPPRAPARPMPRHIEAALRRALATDPAARWPSMAPLLDALARDPRRARRRVVALAAAAVVLVGIGVAGASWTHRTSAVQEAPCAGATAALADTTALREKLSASDARALARVDDWIERWRSGRTAACEDTYVRRTQPPTLLELRELCFDRALAGVHTVLGELAKKPTDQSRLVEQLPVLAECSDVTSLARIAPLPKDATERAVIEELSAGLAKVEVLRMAGKLEDSRVLLAVIEARAQATGRNELVAEALLARGAMAIADNKYDRAQAPFESAAKLASEARDDRLVARAWLSVLDLLVARLEKIEDATKMIPVAQAAVLRAGNTPRLRADMLGTLGDVSVARGELATARAQYTESIALYEQVFGENVELARKLNRLASIASALDDGAAARSHLRRAADILERLYGKRYRHLGVIWTTLGAVEFRAGQFGEARALLERALALKEEAGGKTTPTLVPTLTDLSLTLVQLEEYELAETHIRRALDLARAAYGPDHAKVVHAMLVLARLQIARRDWRGAEETVATALVLQKRHGAALPLDEIERANATILLHAKRYDEARAAVQRALPIALTQGAESYAAAKTHEMIGRIEQARGRREEALAAYERAHALLAARRGPDHPETLVARTSADQVR
ncbi:MAG TPA: serine/threonine-protein kinase, partial [Kofleriaceae bacterium]|nr:serine/threonine-protein kinase [Kofleriaceae bacterium]